MEYRMKKWLVVWIVLILIIFAACGGSSRKAGEPAQEKPESPATAKKNKQVENYFLIAHVSFLPEEEPTVKTDITAVPTLKKEDPSVSFRFRWFVNRQEIPGEDTAILPKAYFKKHDMVNCVAVGFVGSLTTPEYTSDFVRILNSAPVIEENPVDKFSVPGVFTYQIKATDPDEDTLTYALLSPTDLDIEIDPKKGLITWDLHIGVARNLPEVVEIHFTVSDNEMATEGFVRLNFTRLR